MFIPRDKNSCLGSIGMEFLCIDHGDLYDDPWADCF